VKTKAGNTLSVPVKFEGNYVSFRRRVHTYLFNAVYDNEITQCPGNSNTPSNIVALYVCIACTLIV